MAVEEAGQRSAAPARPAADPIRFVVATRVSRERFSEDTALGRSLRPVPAHYAEVQCFADNRRGLPSVYNEAIERAAGDPAILVFVHDDVYLLDYHWPRRLRAALRQHAVVGVAGCTRRHPRQPSWLMRDERFVRIDPQERSGAVAHGSTLPPHNISYYGPPDRPVKLLDGLLLAVHSRTLVDSGLRFDERFDFHFYDLDFCREAERRGVTLGTTSLAVMHGSAGNFASQAWRDGYARYLAKWGD